MTAERMALCGECRCITLTTPRLGERATNIAASEAVTSDSTDKPSNTTTVTCTATNVAGKTATKTFKALLAAYDPEAETNLLSEPYTHCAA